MSECPYHPSSLYRECHHAGDDFVAVWRMPGGDWISTYGTIGKRGSISGFASKELEYMLERLKEPR